MINKTNIENKTQVTVTRPVINLGKIGKVMEKEASFLLKNTRRNLKCRHLVDVLVQHTTSGVQ